MDKRIILAREDLKKTNYWMITLMISMESNGRVPGQFQ